MLESLAILPSKLDLAKDGDDSEEDGVGIANATEDEELNTTVMCV